MNRSQPREPQFRRVVVACDHGGLALKDEVLDMLGELGVEPVDLGTYTSDSVDYPAYAGAAARRVAGGEAEAAILICGTGIGMAIAANKFPGIRAATCSEEFSARMARAHNDANVLALGARVIGAGLARELVRCFCTTGFEGGRHARRVDAIGAPQRGECGS